ncbi:sperm-associated microtubule inner protein 10 [Anolis sagrei]|uniref:sperm-associated microtubule inner protein 10 n=1 Tax=Anolis sagrei TaxID=38937 RepID=UPI0035220EEE
MSNLEATPQLQSKPNVVSKGVNTDLAGLIHCHVPRFSYRHGMIPKLYIMPWKQNMKYRTLNLKHAGNIGLYTGSLEDTLFLEKSERHCHGENRKKLLQKVPQKMTVEDIPIYSHLSRYHKSIVSYGFRIKL